MRVIAGLLMVLVAACGGAPSPSDGPPASSIAPEPSVAEPSVVPQSESPASSPSASRLTARPLGSVDGAPLGYLEYLPPGYGDGTQRPLLLFLHGAGEAGDGSATAVALVEKLGIPSMIAAGDWPADRPFVTLAPQYGTAAADGECAIADDLAGFIDFATEHYDVDPARVYLTGISCGAIGIWDYAATHGRERVAAAVPISGHAEWAFEEAGCALATMPPVWAFHGAKDDVVPVVHIEGPMDKIRACPGADAAGLELTVYPDADHYEHDAWTRTYDLSAGHDIYAWMLEHTAG